MTTNNSSSAFWTVSSSEEYEEADEPPELHLKNTMSPKFRRTPIRQPSEQSSLLTRAFMGYSDDDMHLQFYNNDVSPMERRRSMASNVSIASTADLTSDTGLTSPSRPNTPSPPVPEMAMLQLRGDPPAASKPVSLLSAAVKLQSEAQAAQPPPRKRCIQFACAKPVGQGQPTHQSQPMVKAPSAQEAPRRPCIKFAVPTRPASTQNTPPTRSSNAMSQSLNSVRPESPSTPKRSSGLTDALSTPRQTTVRRASVGRPAYIRANSGDLIRDASQFHEFASGVSREDDWIRHDNPAPQAKLTINDTLTKENHIRRLATEAEEEEEMENEEAQAALDGDDDEDEELDELEFELEEEEDDDEDDDEDDEDDEDENDSDGYHTDEETGFAASDEEDDEDEHMALWTPKSKPAVCISSAIPKVRRTSVHEQMSDSSYVSQTSVRRVRAKRIQARKETPDLPDSTDFVCGTLDEDRPLEEAYMTCIAARRNEKLRIIPQDIDPSFPTSDAEGDEEAEIYNPVHHKSDEEDWIHGQMEDIHHESDRHRRRRKSEHASPRRLRSPPPKRRLSPPPRTRAKSPKPLFGRSPRKMRSPARKPVTTPTVSPRCGQVQFNLAGRPGLTHTKSLPRAGLAQVHMRHGRQHKMYRHEDAHIRGAIDIVKGLEGKRQRRKEKFHQKYCNRARRGQIPERKPMPGRGAERMKELGLLMAGKKDQGNYVLSI